MSFFLKLSTEGVVYQNVLDHYLLVESHAFMHPVHSMVNSMVLQPNTLNKKYQIIWISLIFNCCILTPTKFVKIVLVVLPLFSKNYG